MAFCTNCGNQHSADAKFCSGCGTNLQRSAGAVGEKPDAHVTAVEEQTEAIRSATEAVPVESTSSLDLVEVAPRASAAPVDALTIAPASGLAPAPPQAPQQPFAPPLHAQAPFTPQHFAQPHTPQPFAPQPPHGQWQQPMASPVPPMSAQPQPLPPVPDLAPGVASAPRAGSSTSDLAGMISSLKIPGVPEGESGKPIRLAIVGAGVLVVLGVGIAVLSKIMGALMRGEGILGFIVLLIVAAFGVAGFFAYRAHEQETREARTIGSLPPSVQHVVAQMDGGAQAAFFNEYERFKKRTSISYLLWWLFGAHYFYLRQPMLNVAYWVTGAGAGWWGLFDLFRMRSLVRTANEQSARQALQTLHIGAAFAQMPAAPGLMVQPVPPAPTVYPSPGPAQQDR